MSDSAELANWVSDPQMAGHLTGVEQRMLQAALRVYRRAERAVWGGAFRPWSPVLRASERFLDVYESRAFRGRMVYVGPRGGLCFKGHELEPEPGEAFFEVT